jgi:(+)-beta-caryophyllene/(+)-caryolan-1-ol synthase
VAIEDDEAVGAPAVDLVMPCPGVGCNPAVRDAEADLRVWAHGSGLAGEGTRAQVLADSRPGLVAAWLYPYASIGALGVAARWMAVNFLVDDALDGENDPAACTGAAERLLASLAEDTTRQVPVATAGIDALSPAVAELWRRTCQERSAGWRRIFAEDLRGWLLSYAIEAEDRLHGQVPDLHAYLRHRRSSSGMLVFIDLVELAVGTDLPDEIRGHEAMAAMRAATAEHLGLVNDMYSAAKEHAAEQLHNAVLIIRSQGCSLAEALDRVNEVVTDRLAVFEDAADRLARLPTAPDVSRCVDGYRLLMRGAFDCYAAVDRYTKQAG